MTADLLIRGANLATMSEPSSYGVISNGALAVENGKIVWLGSEADLPASLDAAEEFDAYGQWLTPGLIDCHTHLVWAGNRADEFEMRMDGKTYAEIAQSGGGILSTVRATRSASEEELLDKAIPRLKALMSEGVTTVEIKSGYGLELDSEMKSLAVARLLEEVIGARVTTTFLGAHAIPPEYSDRSDEYIDLLCKVMLPTIKESGLADSVDAFCEQIAFSPNQTRVVLETAKCLGFPIKLHADQLSDSCGAGLVAELGGLSADHVEYTNEQSVLSMAKAGTVAVLLPGAFYMLRETQRPPIGLFRKHGVPMAVATDCNPGTSPCTSILLMLNMACVLFGLTPLEALSGATKNAAKALGKQDRIGQLKVGLQADLALFEIGHPRELAAMIGRNPCAASWVGGQMIFR